MRINRTRIRNIDRYIHPSLAEQFVRVVSPFEDLSSVQLTRAGLQEPLAEGEAYLPPIVGRTTRLNAEGKWDIHRDQAKENRYIRTVHWQWKQWTGGGGTEDMEDSRDIFRKCYPRTLLPAPAEEVIGFPVQGKVVAATEAVSLPGAKEQLRHQVNLMLELFGTCEIVRADGTSASPARTHRRWVFLPSGPYKKGDVPCALDTIFSRLSDGDRRILSERQDFLTELNPQEVAQGAGGFNDYLAYVFPQFGRVVLESLRRDNAIYVFKESWERFSRMTKREILDHNLQDARVLHTKGWQGRLSSALNSK